MHKSDFLFKGMHPFVARLINDFDRFGRNSRYNNATVRMTVRKADGGSYVFVTSKSGAEKSNPRMKNKNSSQTLNLLRFEQVKSESFIFHSAD